MKLSSFFFFSLLLLLCLRLPGQTADPLDWESLCEQAQTEEKTLLLVFSGSDWCKNCMRLEKEVWQSPQFRSWADENILLYRADFPRKKKNRSSKDIQKQNDALAAKYNPKGEFPLVLLLDTEQKVLQRLNYQGREAEAFLQKIKSELP